MSSHSHHDCVLSLSDQDRAGLAVIRRGNGRTLRKSCDRCHQQKLQCVGDKVARCKRCQRVGLECVYSARSGKRPDQSKNNSADTWDSVDGMDAWAAMEAPAGNLDTLFGLDSSQLNDIFPSAILPTNAVGLPGTDGADAIFANGMVALQHKAGDSTSTMKMSLQASQGLTEEAHEPLAECPDPLAELVGAFTHLEATFARTVEDQAGRDPQNYPVGEVLCALERFLGVLKLNNVIGLRGATGPSQSPNDARLRSKQASIAAQGYVLCVRLLVSLSEHMFQSLLGSPLPSTSRTSPAEDGMHSLGSQRRSPGAFENTLFNTTRVPQGLRLRDLHMSAGHFRQALDASVKLIRVGTGRLDEMEYLLGLKHVGSALQESSEKDAPKRSLPARFVASIWEDEASVNASCPRVLLQRYRAAIDGLAEHET